MLGATTTVALPKHPCLPRDPILPFPGGKLAACSFVAKTMPEQAGTTPRADPERSRITTSLTSPHPSLLARRCRAPALGALVLASATAAAATPVPPEDTRSDDHSEADVDDLFDTALVALQAAQPDPAAAAVHRKSLGASAWLDRELQALHADLAPRTP